MRERSTMLPVEQVSFDKENPRIKMALEKYGDNLNAERIHFALQSATDNGGRGTSSYNSLKDSIRTSGGIISPISAIPDGNGYICIDGNTRVAIYKQFAREGVAGDWSKIKAVVMHDAAQRDIETIRISAHLIGSRQWPPYEKARYLHYLRNEKFLNYADMIALCGGNRVDIERQIEAYHDMNEYYRDLVDDDQFQINRYSGFMELQKPHIKNAIFEADLTLRDFGEWIRDGKIYRLDSVRDLPRVLRDEEAKDKFLNGGPRSIEDAVMLLESKTAKDTESTVTLKNATVYQLANTLVHRIDELPFKELSTLRNRENSETAERLRVLEELTENLKRLLDNVSE